MTAALGVALVVALASLIGVVVWAYRKGADAAEAEARADAGEQKLREIADAMAAANSAANADIGDVNEWLRAHGRLRDRP